jgi:hypothetical protein
MRTKSLSPHNHIHIRTVVKFPLAAPPPAITPRGDDDDDDDDDDGDGDDNDNDNDNCKDHAAAITLKERGYRFLCQLSSYLCVIISAMS